MCVMGICIFQHPDFPFICVHNREEDFRRRTNDPTDGDIVCGVDVETGGTWMGLNTKLGSFCALTNFRHRFLPSPSNMTFTSRGHLVNQLIQKPIKIKNGECIPLDFHVNGFSLIAADLFAKESSLRCYFLTNRPHIPICNISLKLSTPPSNTNSENKNSQTYTSNTAMMIQDGLIHCNDGRKVGRVANSEKERECEHEKKEKSAVSITLTEKESIGEEKQRNKYWLNNMCQITELDPQFIHCVSNSHINNESWPKVRKIRQDLKQFLSSFPSMKETKKTEQRTVMELVDGLSKTMTNCDDLSHTFTIPDLSFSSLPPESEYVYQKSIFVSHKETKGQTHLENEGTRAQSIVIRSHQKVYYFYRNTDGFPNIGEWIQWSFSLPFTDL